MQFLMFSKAISCLARVNTVFVDARITGADWAAVKGSFDTLCLELICKHWCVQLAKSFTACPYRAAGLSLI